MMNKSPTMEIAGRKDYKLKELITYVTLSILKSSYSHNHYSKRQKRDRLKKSSSTKLLQ